MKKILLLSATVLSVIGLFAQTNWKKVNAGSIESGITSDPTLRYGVATGFGPNGDDVITVSNEIIMKQNNTGNGTAITLTTLPTGGGLGSKVNGIKKCDDGLIRIWGFFPVNATDYYGVMVSNSSNPTSFVIDVNTLSTFQFAVHPAQRGIVAFTDYSYGAPTQTGYMLYGPDLLTLNGTSVLSTVAFMTPSGVITDLPQFQPNTEERIIPTYPVTNPRIRFLSKRVNGTSTNGDLLIGGNQQTLGAVVSHGLSSFKNSTSTLSDLNVTSPVGNQAVTKYIAPPNKEYVTWKSDNVATNGGIASSGLLEINTSNTIVGVSGGVSNLQSNSITSFDSKLWIGGSRYSTGLPANTYTYVAGSFVDASGSSPNDLDNNGAETLYDLFSTPNFIYATGNFQIASGDVANYIAVVGRNLVALPMVFKSFRAELQGPLVKLYFEMYQDGPVTIEQSLDGTSFSSHSSIFADRDRMINSMITMPISGIIYLRLKSSNHYSSTLVLKQKDNEKTKVFRGSNGIVISTLNKSEYTCMDASGRIIQKGIVESGVSSIQLPITSGIVFIKVENKYQSGVFKVLY